MHSLTKISPPDQKGILLGSLGRGSMSSCLAYWQVGPCASGQRLGHHEGPQSPWGVYNSWTLQWHVMWVFLTAPHVGSLKWWPVSLMGEKWTKLSFFKKDFIYLFLEKGEGRQKGKETSMWERNIDWLPLTCPQPGTWPVPGIEPVTFRTKLFFMYIQGFSGTKRS